MAPKKQAAVIRNGSTTTKQSSSTATKSRSTGSRTTSAKTKMRAVAAQKTPCVAKATVSETKSSTSVRNISSTATKEKSTLKPKASALKGRAKAKTITAPKNEDEEAAKTLRRMIALGLTKLEEEMIERGIEVTGTRKERAEVIFGYDRLMKRCKELKLGTLGGTAAMRDRITRKQGSLAEKEARAAKAATKSNSESKVDGNGNNQEEVDEGGLSGIKAGRVPTAGDLAKMPRFLRTKARQ